MGRKNTQGLAFSLFAFLAHPAYAADVNLITPSGVNVSYDPFTGTQAFEDFQLEINSTLEAPLQAILVITPEIEPEFQFAGIDAPFNFEIETPGGQFSPTRFETPILLEANGGISNFDVRFKIPAGQYADVGNYGMDLKIEVYQRDTLELISDSKIMRVETSVPSRAQTNFAGASPGFEGGSTFAIIDFGDIMPGDTRSVNFQVRSNSEVDIELSSENNGYLVHQIDPLITPIAYSIDADGVASDLSAPLNLVRRPIKSLSGSSYPLNITIADNGEGAFAGSYRDIISIDVTPS